MHIDKFRLDKGGYILKDGCFYETAEEVLQCGILDFCGCGYPERNLIFIKNGLAHINSHRPDSISLDTWYEDWIKEGRRIFGNEQSRYFFFYWCDKEGLTEHGSSVPGWLTDKGRELLQDLTEYEKEKDKEGCVS